MASNKYDINNSSKQLKYNLPGNNLPAVSNRYDSNTASKEVGSLIDRKTLQDLIDAYLASLGLTDTFYAGWSPIINLVSVDPNTTVLQLTDWVGGDGTKPGDIGSYFGTTGFVTDVNSAVNIQGVDGQDGQDGQPFVVNSTGTISTNNSTLTLQNYDGSVASPTSPYWHIVTTDNRDNKNSPVINIVGGVTASGDLAGHLIMSYDFDNVIGTWVDIGVFNAVKGDDGDYVTVLYSIDNITWTTTGVGAKYIWIRNFDGITNALLSEFKDKFVGDDGIGANGTSRVSALDDTLGYLSEKLVVGTYMGLSVLNPDNDETLQLNVIIPDASSSTKGLLTDTDWLTFNSKQAGSAALTSIASLAYSSVAFVKLTGSNTFTLDTTVYYPNSNPAGYTTNLGTVTSVASITLTTVGTDLTSSVANSSTTPVITLNVPNASATNRGALTSTDWSTFNNKQNALGYTPENVANLVTAFQVTPDNTHYPSEKLVKDSLAAYLPLTAIEDTNGLTGFVDGDHIAVSYDWTTKKITLTYSGDIVYYFKGIRKVLGTNTWISDAHTNSTGTFFLSISDIGTGDTPSWGNTTWNFAHVMIAYVYHNAVTRNLSFAIRETHGIMDFKSHEEFHSQIGTYRVSGGEATGGSYTVGSANNANTAPYFDSAILKDEDVTSSVNTISTKDYTLMYIDGTSTSIYIFNNAYPLYAAGDAAYIYLNNPTTGTWTATTTNNRYYNVYQILMPVANDVDSQRYRMVFLQPQATYTSLASAQTEDVRGLKLGTLATLSPEFNIYARVTYLAANGNSNYGKVSIASITYNVGNKAGIVNINGFTPSDHTALTSLTWSISGHIGTASSFAAFDSSGASTYILQNTIVPYTGATSNLNLGAYSLTATNATLSALTNNFVPYKTSTGFADSVINGTSGKVSIIANALAATSLNSGVTISYAAQANVTVGQTLGYYSLLAQNNNTYNIASGITESGARGGLWVQSIPSDSAFLGTLTTQYGIRVQYGTNTGNGAGVITNSYGLHLQRLNAGSSTVTNPWGVYQASNTDKNYFAGSVLIGQTTGTDALDVTGASVFTGTAQITGNTIIGSTTAANKLTINSIIYTNDQQGGISITAANAGINRWESKFDLISSSTSIPRIGITGITRDSGGTVTSSVESLSIKLANGYVGILKTAPTEALDVAGNALISGTLAIDGTRVFRDAATAMSTTIDFKATTNYTKTLAGNETWAFSNIKTDTGIAVQVTQPGTLYTITCTQATVTFSGDVNSSGVIQGMAINKKYLIGFLPITTTNIWVYVKENQA